MRLRTAGDSAPQLCSTALLHIPTYMFIILLVSAEFVVDGLRAQVRGFEPAQFRLVVVEVLKGGPGEHCYGRAALKHMSYVPLYCAAVLLCQLLLQQTPILDDLLPRARVCGGVAASRARPLIASGDTLLTIDGFVRFALCACSFALSPSCSLPRVISLSHTCPHTFCCCPFITVRAHLQSMHFGEDTWV